MNNGYLCSEIINAKMNKLVKTFGETGQERKKLKKIEKRC